MEYVKSVPVYLCPADTDSLGRFGGSKDISSLKFSGRISAKDPQPSSGEISYGMNTLRYQGSTKKWATVEPVKLFKSTRKGLLGEVEWVETTYRFRLDPLNPSSSSNTTALDIIRHGGRSNVTYTDASVESGNTVE